MGFLRAGRVHRLSKENLSKVPQSAGNYTLYDKNRKPVYVGTTAGNTGARYANGKGHYRYGLRHRLGSYQQKDDYKEHPTKKALKAKYFAYRPIRNDNTRRAAEKREKQGMRHNHL